MDMDIPSAYRRLVPALIVTALLVAPPTAMVPWAMAAESTATPSGANVVAGKILSLSRKANSLTIETDDHKTELIRFDNATKGLEHLTLNEETVITLAERGGEKVASEITPRHAILPAGVGEASLDEVAALIRRGPEQGNYFLVDSRPTGRWEAGHIPTAVSIPLDRLEATGATFLPSEAKINHTLLIFYCDGPTCGLSTRAAALACKLGYGHVKVALEGEPGWAASGRPLVAADRYVDSGNIVLLDLRSPEEARQGHIRGAVNIPMARLGAMKVTFPSQKTAPIVLYGNGTDAEQAAHIIAREWGYKTVALVDGGLQGFTARGNQLVTGPAATEITWSRQLGEGEVGLAEFMRAAAGATPDQAILDVRSQEETASGMFPNAIHIPLDQIVKRKAELPKDKELLLYCSSGARAEMAWRALTRQGIKARFLKAHVECAQGSCHATE